MLRSSARRAVGLAGLTDVARRLRLWIEGGERSVSIDGTEVTFEQREFGDYIELNQIGAEREIIARLCEEARPDDVFLDVGSNLGTFALFLGDVLNPGNVVAVEPIPATAEKIERNFARNGVEGAVCPVAFSDEADTVTMAVPDSHGSSAIDPDGSGPTVRRVRGDDYLADSDLPSPTIVKIDVEGHESAAICGLDETLSRPECRLVYCEVHDTGDADQSTDPRSLLVDRGFSVERVAELPGRRHILRAARE